MEDAPTTHREELDLLVSASCYPLSHKFLSQLPNRGIDLRTLVAIRQRPILLSNYLARMILMTAGELIIEEVARRTQTKARPKRLPLDFVLCEDSYSMAGNVRLIVILWRAWHKLDDGWAVVIGNVWDVIGNDRHTVGDPFAMSTPRLEELEKILEGLVEKVMNSIPMEQWASHLGPAAV